MILHSILAQKAFKTIRVFHCLYGMVLFIFIVIKTNFKFKYLLNLNLKFVIVTRNKMKKKVYECEIYLLIPNYEWNSYLFYYKVMKSIANDNDAPLSGQRSDTWHLCCFFSLFRMRWEEESNINKKTRFDWACISVAERFLSGDICYWFWLARTDAPSCLLLYHCGDQCPDPRGLGNSHIRRW